MYILYSDPLKFKVTGVLQICLNNVKEPKILVRDNFLICGCLKLKLLLF